MPTARNEDHLPRALLEPQRRGAGEPRVQEGVARLRRHGRGEPAPEPAAGGGARRLSLSVSPVFSPDFRRAGGCAAGCAAGCAPVEEQVRLLRREEGPALPPAEVRRPRECPHHVAVERGPAGGAGGERVSGGRRGGLAGGRGEEGRAPGARGACGASVDEAVVCDRAPGDPLPEPTAGSVQGREGVMTSTAQRRAPGRGGGGAAWDNGSAAGAGASPQTPASRTGRRRRCLAASPRQTPR